MVEGGVWEREGCGRGRGVGEGGVWEREGVVEGCGGVW